MKFQILFFGKNKKNISKCCLLKFLSSMQSVNDVLADSPILTLLLLNTTCPVLANSVDLDQLASELIWICTVSQ